MKVVALFRYPAITDPDSLVDVTLPGDEAYDAGHITRPGSNSEVHLVDERIVALKPKTVDFTQVPQPR